MEERPIWLITKQNVDSGDPLRDGFQEVATRKMARITEMGFQLQQATFGAVYLDAKVIRIWGNPSADFLCMEDPKKNPNVLRYGATLKRRHIDQTAFYIRGVKEAKQ